MRYYPKNEAESDELETFFLKIARRNRLNLRLRNDTHGFVLRWQGEVRELDFRWMEVEISNSPVAVRLDARCGAKELHEILERMGVKHYYQEDEQQPELSMSIPAAMKHLQAAFDALHEAHEKSWQERNAMLSGAPKGIKQP